MKQLDYQPFLEQAQQTVVGSQAEELYRLAQFEITACNHGHLDMWLDALQNLPHIGFLSTNLNSDTILAGLAEDCDDTVREQIYIQLQKLRPWRKGPFNICGLQIDTEWRSDWKWNRLKDHIQPLDGRTVLDIGCGSGYHCWRMAGAGAKLVIGIEPYKVFVMQFWAMRHFLNNNAAWVLPLGIEDIPNDMNVFDTVFSMGVLYHRKSPMDHLLKLHGLLRSGGELVLETLVIDGGPNEVLAPEGRYAKMRNVWFLPSCQALELWLRKCGYKNVRTINVARTSIEEQRTTDWMRWESLRDYLHPENPELSLEGYPAPTRAIVLANAP